jgi:hypothetical protein
MMMQLGIEPRGLLAARALRSRRGGWAIPIAPTASTNARNRRGHASRPRPYTNTRQRPTDDSITCTRRHSPLTPRHKSRPIASRNRAS